MGAVRLDHEILQQALVQAGETTPHDAADANLSNRNLDDVSLLASETPMLENLNLAFNCLRRVHPIQKLVHLAKLNLSHNDLLDVERLGVLQDLEVLNLSKNKLTSVGSISELQALEELWLRDNQISELYGLQGLAQCASLKRLVVKPNPVCKKCPDLYWPFLVHNIPSLEMLDGRPVGAAERDAASAFLVSPEGRKQLREAGLNSRCNARVVVPPAHQPAEEDGWAHDARNRRPAPPPKKSKSADGTLSRRVCPLSSIRACPPGRRAQACVRACTGRTDASGRTTTGPRKTARMGDVDEQSQDSASARSGRPGRVPLSSRRAPAQGGGGDAGVGGGGRATESDGYKQLYSNGQIAVVARRDGTSEARYFNGSVAVSLDVGRVTAMYRNGDVAVTSDENGNAMVCLPSGLTIYNHSQGAGGRLQDLVTGEILEEWDASCRPKGAKAETARNPGAGALPAVGSDNQRGSIGNKALLQCRLNEHIGVRVANAGGKVEVFFVCDGSGAKGGGGGLPGSTKKEPSRRIKHRFSAARPAGRADWDDTGPFGDGAAPVRERGPVVKPITTDEYVSEIRAATDQIIDFEALTANLGSGEDIPLAFRGKINAAGTTAATMAVGSTKANVPGAAARRAAYDKTMRGKPEKSDPRQIPRAASDTAPGARLTYADPPTHSHSPGPYSQLQSYGTPTGSPSKRSPGKASPYKGMSPKSPGVVLADDPTELVQQLARNAQDALKRLAINLAEEKQVEAVHKSLSPSKQRKPPRAPAAEHARAKPSGHAGAHARRAPQAAGPDKYLSPGGGYNGSTGGSERKPARVARKKVGGDKLSTGEEVTPDLPAEEMQRLEAIRAQMRNMMSSLGGGY